MKKRFITALCTLLLSFTALQLNAQIAFSLTDEESEQNTPDGWTAVSLPVIPTITSSNTFDITTYGASTSSADNTTAIQAALDAAASAGGGMVVVPAGTYLTSYLQMGSKTVLHLSAGATLKMKAITTFGIDDNGYHTMTAPLITGKSGASDIVIEGESRTTSIIDGQGAPWWDEVEAAKAASKSTTRQALIRFWQGSRYLFRNFRVQNAPNTNITIGRNGTGSHATAHDITIINPASTAADPSHNTDGFPIWTQYVNIYDCEIDTGDDNVVTDSGAQFVHVWNCDLKAGHGASLGSYTVDMHDILYEDLTFTGTDCGFRLKSNRDRSGDVYNITFRNCTMTGVASPFVITSWYDTLPDAATVAASPDDLIDTTPRFHDILIQNVTVSGHTTYQSSGKNYYGIFIYGRPESLVKDVTFDNVNITHSKGIKMNFCQGIKFYDNCSFEVSNTNNTSKNAVATADLENVIEEKYECTYAWNESKIGAIKNPAPHIVSWNTNPTCTNDNTDCSTTGDKNNLATWIDGTSVKIMRGDKGMSNGSNITVNSTSYKTIKVSNGAQNKLTMPTGKYAYAVDFYSYVNKTQDGDYYWQEVNGTSYTEPKLTCLSNGDLTNPDKASFSLGGVSSFTFTNAGTQLCYVLFIRTTPISAHPADATYGQNESPSALTVTAASTAGTLNYQWYRCDDTNMTNPVEISGATSASYDAFSTATIGTYYYFCTVTDDNGTFASDVATIEIVDAASLHTVTFSIGEVTGVSGIVPEAVQASSVTISTNRTLFKEGYTLTGWNDGNATYAIGDTYVPTGDATMTPVFTANTVELSDALKDVTVTWDFQRQNGAPTVQWQNRTGDLLVTQAKVNGVFIDVKLGINTNPGKFNNTSWDDWCQVNEGTTFTLPSRSGAVVNAYSMNEPKNGSSVKSTLDGNEYSSYSSNVASYSTTEDAGTSTLLIKGGSYYRYVQLVYPGTGDAWANFQSFEMDLTNGSYIHSDETSNTTIGFKKDGENIVRSAADDDENIGTLTGKFHSNEHGLQNFSMSVAVPGYVKISAGTCAWGGKLTITGANSFSKTINTNTGACFHQNKTANKVYAYYTTNEGTTLTIAGGSYMPYIAVESIDFYAITGTIDGGNIDGKKVIFTSELTGQTFEATVASNAFTLNVPADTYTVTLSDNNDYVISSPTSVVVTAAAAVTINIVEAAPQTVTGAITNAPAEAFTLTFTGANNTESVNCAAGATSFTKNLMPDTYVMSTSVGTLSPMSVASFKVVNAAVSHNIYFPEVIPAATQQNITVDNTAAVAANVYNTLSDALAAAKAGSISSPVITLTSGQTYKEQVIVDQANVTLKTSGAEKATITWYYGIGYSYYSLNDKGYYDKDRAMTRNEKLEVGPGRWGATILVTKNGNNFKAENIIFENSFNQRYTTEEVEDGVEYNLLGDAKITYDRTLQPSDPGYKAADSKAATERAAAIAFENNPTGCELYNCEFLSSQDTFYSSGNIYVKRCSIMGNTDYIFGGGNVVFDDCDLVIGGYSDQEASAYITANSAGANEYYIFRDCTVKPSARTYIKSNLGRDWGGVNTHVYFFNLKNEIGNKLEYKWNNMGGGVTAGTADLHIYDFDPTINANYATTGASGANINGLVSDADALTLYSEIVDRLGFTPTHIYDDNVALGESSAYNVCRIAASDGAERTVELTRGITADKWSTIVLPFALSSEQITTAFGAGTQVAELASSTETGLTFNTVTAMTANRPYAIKVSSDFAGATINGVTIAKATPEQTVGNWVFNGTYTSQTAPVDSYVFSGNKLRKVTDNNVTVKPFRAYITYNGVAPANELEFILDGETTGVETVYGLPFTVDSYYDLQGRKVVNGSWSMVNGQLKKGVYIVNGRKTIVK